MQKPSSEACGVKSGREPDDLESVLCCVFRRFWKTFRRHFFRIRKWKTFAKAIWKTFGRHFLRLPKAFLLLWFVVSGLPVEKIAEHDRRLVVVFGDGVRIPA